MTGDVPLPRMTCGCIEMINNALAERNGELVTPIFGPQRVFIEVMKRDEKKRGKLPKLFASFCPF